MLENTPYHIMAELKRKFIKAAHHRTHLYTKLSSLQGRIQQGRCFPIAQIRITAHPAGWTLPHYSHHVYCSPSRVDAFLIAAHPGSTFFPKSTTVILLFPQGRRFLHSSHQEYCSPNRVDALPLSHIRNTAQCRCFSHVFPNQDYCSGLMLPPVSNSFQGVNTFP